MPHFQLLSTDALNRIHTTSMKLLAQVGVAFPQAEVLDIFRRQGARTDGNRVFLTELQVMEAIKSVPPEFEIRARNPARSVTVGSGGSVFAPGYGAPFLVDAELGKRSASQEDYHQLARLSHALPNQDVSGYLLVDPEGMPASHLHMLYAHMLHSDKPFMGSTAGMRGAEQTLEMASILFGGELNGQAVTISLINSLSPLSYSTEMLDVLLKYTQARQPVVIAALAMAGSTGPATLAGTLTMQTAELLAGVVLTQWISPGTPVVLGSTSTNIDMQSGALCIGSPELSQLIAAHAQIARYYGIPSRSGGALTDSSYPDAQAGFESMMGLLTAVNSGIDFVLHSAGILSSYLAFSYEKFVLDDEMCGMVRRLQRGFDVTPDSLAYDVIASVGPGGNFLMEDHTLKHCRTEFWRPAVCDRGGLEAWMASGRRDAVARARSRWQKLVQEHKDPDIDSTTQRQLSGYVQAQT
jgi:trimethylamine---corrinoid protein Co-methyltransferase